MHRGGQQPGLGSRFTVELVLPVAPAPVVVPAQWSAAPVEEAPAGPAGLRVLVADDDPVNRHVLTAMLEHLGAQVSALPDAELRRQSLAGIDLVLLDERMPGIDGVTALRRLLAGSGKGGLPRVVGCTGHGGQNARQRWLDARAHDVVAKPAAGPAAAPARGQLCRAHPC